MRSFMRPKNANGSSMRDLSQLKSRLADTRWWIMAKIPRDRVGLGSTVVVLDLQKDEEVTYKLVTSEETDVSKGLISTSSPIGRGLLGKRVGDEVKFPSPGGMREMEILKLTTIHDSAFSYMALRLSRAASARPAIRSSS